MCLGGICSCAYTWHYDSEYRSERALAVQTCIFVDFVCFQNMNSNKLCVYQAFGHTCFGGACMFISRTERYSRTYSLLKGHASNMLWMCVCVCLPGIQTNMYWRSQKYILVNYVQIFMWRSYYSVCLPVKLHVDRCVFIVAELIAYSVIQNSCRRIIHAEFFC